MNPQSSGPTRSTLSTRSRIASACSIVVGLRCRILRNSSSLMAVPAAACFCTWKVCVPRTLISFSMAVWTTEMPVMTEMIDAMPAMIPTIVRNDLILWARIAAAAIRNASRKNTVDSVPLRPPPRASARRPPILYRLRAH